jgi:hypothetical protein
MSELRNVSGSIPNRLEHWRSTPGWLTTFFLTGRPRIGLDDRNDAHAPVAYNCAYDNAERGHRFALSFTRVHKNDRPPPLGVGISGFNIVATGRNAPDALDRARRHRGIKARRGVDRRDCSSVRPHALTPERN